MERVASFEIDGRKVVSRVPWTVAEVASWDLGIYCYSGTVEDRAIAAAGWLAKYVVTIDGEHFDEVAAIKAVADGISPLIAAKLFELASPSDEILDAYKKQVDVDFGADEFRDSMAPMRCECPRCKHGSKDDQYCKYRGTEPARPVVIWNDYIDGTVSGDTPFAAYLLRGLRRSAEVRASSVSRHKSAKGKTLATTSELSEMRMAQASILGEVVQ